MRWMGHVARKERIKIHIGFWWRDLSVDEGITFQGILKKYGVA